MKRLGPDVLEETKICCVERAGTPCLDQKCCQSHITNLSLCYFGILVSNKCQHLWDEAKCLIWMKLKWICSWIWCWLGSGEDMGPKIAVSDCKLEYKFSIRHVYTALPQYGCVYIMGGVNTVKRDNININICYFSRHCFAILWSHLPGSLRAKFYVMNHRTSSRDTRWAPMTGGVGA